jgi:hypothetical protein
MNTNAMFNMIFSALGGIGTLLFAYISIKRLDDSKDSKLLLIVVLASSITFLAFCMPSIYSIYQSYGAYSFVTTIFLVCIPLFEFAIIRYAAYRKNRNTTPKT